MNEYSRHTTPRGNMILNRHPPSFPSVPEEPYHKRELSPPSKIRIEDLPIHQTKYMYHNPHHSPSASPSNANYPTSHAPHYSIPQQQPLHNNQRIYEVKNMQHQARPLQYPQPLNHYQNPPIVLQQPQMGKRNERIQGHEPTYERVYQNGVFRSEVEPYSQHGTYGGVRQVGKMQRSSSSGSGSDSGSKNKNKKGDSHGYSCLVYWTVIAVVAICALGFWLIVTRQTSNIHHHKSSTMNPQTKTRQSIRQNESKITINSTPNPNPNQPSSSPAETSSTSFMFPPTQVSPQPQTDYQFPPHYENNEYNEQQQHSSTTLRKYTH